MKSTSYPSIFVYQNAASFLCDVYDFRKEQNPDLSVRKWAQQIGIESPQVLMAILKGTKKISLNLVPLFVEKLNLEPVEAQYFELLVKFAKARTLDEKNALELAIKEVFLSMNAPVVILEDYDIFSHWVYSAILDICNLKNVHISKMIITDALKVKVAPEVIDDAIEKLLRIKLLSFHETTGYRKVEAHLTSKNDVKVKSVHEYYRQTADLAKNACEIDVNEREFQCFSIAVNHRDIANYKEIIRDFRRKVSALSSPNADQVYQLNVQFFPLTSAIGGNALDEQRQSLI